MEPCVFCQRADRPMTREHVFAHWLVRHVHGAQLLASDRALRSLETTTPTRIARVVAGVCPECNAGWMSSLEMGFRRVLFARSRVGPVGPPDRIALSRWFTKTAVLLAHADGAVLVGAVLRAQLAHGMPEGIEVFLARRRRPPQRLDFAVDATGDQDAGAVHVRSVAILIDDLVAHVAVRGTLTSRHGTRLWPLRSHTLRWETLPVVTSMLR